MRHRVIGQIRVLGVLLALSCSAAVATFPADADDATTAVETRLLDGVKYGKF